MKTIQEEWDEYKTAVYKTTKLSEVHEAECKRAFLAGATVVLSQFIGIGQDPNISEDQGVEIIKTLANDVIDHVRRLISSNRNN